MKHLYSMCVAVMAAVLVSLAACKQQPAADAASADNIYQFTVLDADSNAVSMADFGGKVMLVVNTATRCGFTPQYEGLQKLYNRYGGQGFVVLDFPCNQFGAQAPGSNADIKAFCTGTFNTTFPQMNKIDVNGDSEEPLFAWLKSKAPFAGFDTQNPIGAYLDSAMRADDPLYDQDPSIKWNFTKFLIGRDGQVVARFEPTADMNAIEEAIKSQL